MVAGQDCSSVEEDDICMQMVSISLHRAGKFWILEASSPVVS